MDLYQPREVVGNHLGGEDAVRKVPRNVALWPRERNFVHPLVDALQVVVVHHRGCRRLFVARRKLLGATVRRRRCKGRRRRRCAKFSRATPTARTPGLWSPPCVRGRPGRLQALQVRRERSIFSGTIDLLTTTLHSASNPHTGLSPAISGGARARETLNLRWWDARSPTHRHAVPAIPLRIWQPRVRCKASRA